MNYKIYVYIITAFLSLFSLSSINFEKFIKKNKVIETKILVMLLGFALSYLVSNFIFAFFQK